VPANEKEQTQYSDLEERDLIAICLSPDAGQANERAWEEVVRRFRRRVFGIAYKFTGRYEESQDLTQEIFLRVFKSLEKFDQSADFGTWLYSVSRNHCIDHYRSVRKERETMDRTVDAADLAPVAHGPDALSRLQRLDRRDLLRRALLALPDSLRSAVVLRDLRDFSYQDIAAALGLPEGTVKSRINRGRNELARRIVKLEREQAPALTPRAASAPAPSGVPE